MKYVVLWLTQVILSNVPVTTAVLEPMEAQNQNDLPNVVEPFEAQNNIQLPIVVEPIEAQNKLASCVIEPMTYERLSSLKSSANLQYRLEEENRLDQLAQATTSAFKYYQLFLCNPDWSERCHTLQSCWIKHKRYQAAG